jgi:hypothetical protein
MSLATFWRCFAARFPKDANAVSSVASPIDSPGVFACRAATAASGVNAPEKRPSLGATSAEGRRAQPGGTAR